MYETLTGNPCPDYCLWRQSLWMCVCVCVCVWRGSQKYEMVPLVWKQCLKMVMNPMLLFHRTLKFCLYDITVNTSPSFRFSDLPPLLYSHSLPYSFCSFVFICTLPQFNFSSVVPGQLSRKQSQIFGDDSRSNYSSLFHTFLLNSWKMWSSFTQQYAQLKLQMLFINISEAALGW